MRPRSWRLIAFGVVTAVVVQGSLLRVSAQAKLPPAVLPQNPVIGQLTVGQGAPVAIYAVSLDVKNPLADDGSGTGRANFSDLSIQKLADALSTDLFRLALRGEHVPQVRIELYNAGTTTVASTYLLENVLVTGFATAGAGEAVTFHYERLTFGTSGAPFCWDLKQNKAC
jgi:hypothetical protein